YSASADAKTPAAIRLEQRNRLGALDDELAAAKTLRATLEGEFLVARQHSAASQENVRAAQRALREVQSALAEAQDRATRVARKAAEGMGQIASLEAEIRALEDRRVTALNAVEAAQERLTALGDANPLIAALDAAKRHSA